jgi:hypothetical protein
MEITGMSWEMRSACLRMQPQKGIHETDWRTVHDVRTFCKLASSRRIDDPDHRNQSQSIFWKVTSNCRGIVVIANRFHAAVRELDDDLSAMPFGPNLRAFQRRVIGLTGADRNFGDDRSFKRASEK